MVNKEWLDEMKEVNDALEKLENNDAPEKLKK